MTTPKTETREARGIALHRSRGHEIREVEPGIHRVPSSTGRGFYRVDLERETCECPDHEHRQARCLHVYAVLIFAAQKKCRRATTERPERRHGERQERPGDTSPRRGGNRPQRPDTTTPRRSEEGSLRGVLANPERLAKVAERLGA